MSVLRASGSTSVDKNPRSGALLALLLAWCLVVGLVSVVASPARAAVGRRAASVASGVAPSEADPPPRSVYMVGTNGYGQLGRTPTSYDDGSVTPQLVPLPGTITPDRMVVIGSTSYLITTDAEVWTWGRNVWGALGDGTDADLRATPQRIDVPGGAADLAVSDLGHAIVATRSGALYTWGYQYRGVANGDDLIVEYHQPQRVTVLPAGVSASAVATSNGGNAESVLDFAIGSDHHLYSWAIGPTGPGPASRLDLPGGVDVSAIATSADGLSVVALGANGAVYVWNFPCRTTNPTCSEGTVSDLIGGGHATPTLVPLPAGASAAQIAVGRDTAFVRTTDGRLFGWGANNYYQLGDGTLETRTQPVPLPLPGATRALAVAAGDGPALAIGADGRTYAWGAGAALGTGLGRYASVPTRVALPRGADGISVATSSTTAAFVVDNDPYAPAFDPAAPPQALFPGQQISYQFTADARPSARFHLAPGAPAWLAIDADTGLLSGTAPDGATQAAYTVIASNSQGSASAGPFQAISGAAVTITGTVRLSASGAALAAARIEACLQTLCTSGTSAPDGTFSLPWYAGHPAAVTVYPPTTARLLPIPLGSRPIPEAGLDLGELVLPPLPAPAAIQDPDFVTTDGTPVVHWAHPVSMSTSGCDGGLGVASVVGSDAQTGEPLWDVYPLPPSTGPGNYASTLPPLFPMHGGAHLSTDVLCPPSPDEVLQGAGGVRSSRSNPAATAAHQAAAANLAGLSPEQVRAIITFTYNHWELIWKVKKNFDVSSAIAGILLAQGCFEDISALKALVKLALSPLISAAVDALTPELIELALSVALINPIAAVLVVPVMRFVIKKLLSALVDKLIDAALEAAMLKYCTKPISPNILIDPSGTVVDQYGSPVVNARVELLRAETIAGPFAPMSTSDVGIEPTLNPETTGADGAFHWDVRAGFYELRATAPGCGSSTSPGAPAELLGPLPVPPPQVGLTVSLFCRDAMPPAPPTVAALDAHVGAPSGGTDVMLSGTGFTPHPQVYFGDTPAASVEYVSPTLVLAQSPAGVGQVHVTVSTSGGTSSPTDADRFTYAVRATVTAISPAHGPRTGGTVVTVTGSGFTGAQGVSFGDMPAASFHVDSDGVLHATTHAADSGPADVTVFNAAGSSQSTPSAVFTYDAVAAGTPPPPTSDLQVRLAAPRTVGSRARSITVSVRNVGPDAALGVSTRLSLPRGLVTTAGRRTMTFHRASIARGGRVTYLVRVHSVTKRGQIVVVRSAVSCTTRDPHLADNGAQARVRLR